MRSDRRLLYWYNLIREKFFYGEIEISPNVCVRWSTVDDQDERNMGSADLCHDGYHDYEILINPEYNPCLNVILTTLVHEMCHIATDLRDEHDEPFERVRKLLDKRGIFKLGAVRKGATLL